MPSTTDLAARLSAVVETQQQVLAAIADPDRVMRLIVDLVPEVTNGAGAVIELVDGQDLVYRAASGTAAAHVGLRLASQSSLSGHAIKSRTVIRCDDTQLDSRVDAAACEAIGARSMIIAPLLHAHSCVGVLKTFSPHPRSFNDLDAYTLQLLAGMTAAALQQAEDFRERTRSEERYRMLFDANIAGVFRSTRDGRILDCNKALVDWLGFDSRDDLLSRQSWDLYPSRGDREVFLESLERTGVLTNVRLQLKRKDGSPLCGVVNVGLLSSKDGEMQLLGTLVPEPGSS